MKKLISFICILLIFFCSFNVFAKEIIEESNMESVILLDVARRYYTVSEIKEYIDALSVNSNSTLQLHFTDDENVGIECRYLDQTIENATYDNGVYTNPVTGKEFLSYEQVTELMNYAKSKNVNFVPEIDVPAHMKGFFTLAINKFGEGYVRNRYNWDDPSSSGIAWGSGDEEGNLDLMSPNAKPFVMNLLDEYTSFFKDCKYFHIGFDEYTFRPEMKIDYANEIYNYLTNKGFVMRMWSDAITKDNISDLNNNIQITYWGWKEANILDTNYATVTDLQERDFKIIITNKYYLFFVPNVSNISNDSLNYTINKIDEEWELERWNYNFSSDLENHNNILGGMVCTWGENSSGVSKNIIKNHTVNMYNSMFRKLDKYRNVKIVEDDIDNPSTGDYNIFLITTIGFIFLGLIYKTFLISKRKNI